MRERSPYFGNSIGIYPCDECRQSDLSFPVIDSKVGHPNESCGSPPQDHWSRRCGVVRPERGPTSGQKPSSRQLCLSWLGIAVFSRTDFSFRPLATIERKWRTQAGMRHKLTLSHRPQAGLRVCRDWPTAGSNFRGIDQSKGNFVRPLELELLARLARGCDFEAQALDDLPRRAYLIGDRLRQLAGAEPERILQADAHIPDRGLFRRPAKHPRQSIG